MLRTINIYTDPGHGWARVKRAELIKLGIISKITSYSYERNDSVYLEEDCDLGAYIKALKDRGHEIKFRETSCDRRYSRIRNYRRFSRREGE